MSSERTYEDVLASLTPEQQRVVSARLKKEEDEKKQAEAREKQAEAREKQIRLEKEADAAAFRVALAAEQAEKQSLRAGQSINDYIARAFRYNFHLPRLLPKKRTASSSKKKSPSPATTGRTSIHGKYYPLKLEIWQDCDAVLRESFQAISARLGAEPLFPSRQRMDVVEESFLEELPQEFIHSPLYLTELKTSFFVHEVLEKPASRVLNAYFSKEKVFFDNKNAGAHVRYITREGGEERSRGQTSSDASIEQQNENENERKPKVPVKVQADCVVLCAEMNTILEEDEEEEKEEDERGKEDKDKAETAVYRIAFGEHKPAHRLRAPILQELVQKTVAPDYILQMARRKATGQPNEDAKKVVPGSALGQVYYTYALAQTFHYMVSAGILYGYLVSGDTVTFLHIPRQDGTTLLYRPVVFLEFSKGLETDSVEAYIARLTADIPSLPVAQLCGMAVKAKQDGTEGERWRTETLRKLAEFPSIPLDLLEGVPSAPPSESPSSPGKRPFDGDEDDDSGDGSGPRGRSAPRQRHLAVRHTSQPRVPSPLGPSDPSTSRRCLLGLRAPVYLQPSRFDPVSFRPLRPYCTQACLLGLAQGLPLDEKCPNVFLHQRAARLAAGRLGMTADDMLPARYGEETLHAVRGTKELARLLVLQLYGNILQDCQCLLDEGQVGRIGCLFRLTLTGYGYTFVGKGVQAFDRRRLQRERDVYKQLAAQQGKLVPVYLGTANLLLPYPRNDSVLVSHMMLLSYSGPGLHSHTLNRRTRPRRDLAGIDLHSEAERTWEELQRLGLEDDDVENMESNFTWCDEARRMMRVDFHQAHVRKEEECCAQPQLQLQKDQHQEEARSMSISDSTPSTRRPSPALQGFSRKRSRSITDDYSRPIKRVLGM